VYIYFKWRLILIIWKLIKSENGKLTVLWE
jgi:hypothetical protein